MFMTNIRGLSGLIHLIVEEQDVDKVEAWFGDAAVQGVYVHSSALPAEFDATHTLKLENSWHTQSGNSYGAGYFLQQLVGFHADEWAARSGSRAQFIAMMDSDVLLGMPVTCRSLFDNTGRPFLVAWDIEAQVRSWVDEPFHIWVSGPLYSCL